MGIFRLTYICIEPASAVSTVILLLRVTLFSNFHQVPKDSTKQDIQSSEVHSNYLLVNTHKRCLGVTSSI